VYIASLFTIIYKSTITVCLCEPHTLHYFTLATMFLMLSNKYTVFAQPSLCNVYCCTWHFI